MADTESNESSNESAGVGLSPPWVTTYKKIASAIGADKTYKVLPLQGDSNYSVTIQSLPGSNPYALAAVLKPSYSYGNITLTVQVLDPSGKPIRPMLPVGTTPVNAVLQAVEGAFKNNSFFVKAMAVSSPPWIGAMGVVVVVFTKSVIQFFNDDLSDPYGNFNGVTSTVFTDILQTTYPGPVILSTTTQNDPNYVVEGETAGGWASDGSSSGGGSGSGGGQ